MLLLLHPATVLVWYVGTAALLVLHGTGYLATRRSTVLVILRTPYTTIYSYRPGIAQLCIPWYRHIIHEYVLYNTCILKLLPGTTAVVHAVLPSLRPLHKTPLQTLLFLVGVALLRCLLLCPLSPREAFGFLWFCSIVVVYRFIVIVIELSKQFRYDIIVSLSNDIIESFDTISNANTYIWYFRT